METNSNTNTSTNNSQTDNNKVIIAQNVAILVDGNNVERSIEQTFGVQNGMANFDALIPKLLGHRALNRMIYFREGVQISSKLADRLHEKYHGSVRPCHKSADIPLTIKAMQLAGKVDAIIIMSGDSDYTELVRHLKFEGVRVEICAVPENTAKILLEEADYFHPFTKEDCFVYGGSSGGGGTRSSSAGRESRGTSGSRSSSSSSSTGSSTGQRSSSGSGRSRNTRRTR